MSRLVAGDGCLLRTARKPWTCVAGGCAIAPGERYLENLGETPAYTSGSRYCLPCAQAAGLAQRPDPITDALEAGAAAPHRRRRTRHADRPRVRRRPDGRRARDRHDDRAAAASRTRRQPASVKRCSSSR